jgi:hypothetical protein
MLSPAILQFGHGLESGRPVDREIVRLLPWRTEVHESPPADALWRPIESGGVVLEAPPERLARWP